jgi:hypothetical protein
MRLCVAAAALAVGAVSASVATSVSAQAEPPCARFDVCQYMPNPYNNGPLMPTWERPGNYGGRQLANDVRPEGVQMLSGHAGQRASDLPGASGG